MPFSQNLRKPTATRRCQVAPASPGKLEFDSTNVVELAVTAAPGAVHREQDTVQILFSLLNVYTFNVGAAYVFVDGINGLPHCGNCTALLCKCTTL